MSQGFSSVWWPTPCYQGGGGSHVAGSEDLRVGLIWLHSLYVCALPPPSTGTLTQRGTVLEQEELEWVLGMGCSAGCGSDGTSRSPGQLLIFCLHRHQQCPDAVLSLSCLFPSQLHTPLSHGSPLSSVELHWEQEGLEQVLCSGWGVC